MDVSWRPKKALAVTFSDDGVQEGFSTIFAKMFNGLDTLHGDNASDESLRKIRIFYKISEK